MWFDVGSSGASALNGCKARQAGDGVVRSEHNIGWLFGSTGQEWRGAAGRSRLIRVREWACRSRQVVTVNGDWRVPFFDKQVAEALLNSSFVWYPLGCIHSGGWSSGRVRAGRLHGARDAVQALEGCGYVADGCGCG